MGSGSRIAGRITGADVGEVAGTPAAKDRPVDASRISTSRLKQIVRFSLSLSVRSREKDRSPSLNLLPSFAKNSPEMDSFTILRLSPLADESSPPARQLPHRAESVLPGPLAEGRRKARQVA